MKIKFILSSCTLFLFTLLAGSSFDETSFMFLIFLCVIVIIGAVISVIVESNNKSKRLKMIKQDETETSDFDRSVNFGNDRCMFYFDSAKKKVMIMRVMTEGIKKKYVDDFEFSGKNFCFQNDPYFCIYDVKNRRLLCGEYENMDVKFTNTNLKDEDKHKEITPHNYIQAKLTEHSINKDIIAAGVIPEYVYTLVDECHGMIAIVRKGKVSSIFNYINNESLSKKTGDKSFINHSFIGNYYFIMDDFFDVLVIITPSSYELFNYSEIIEVSYEENGNQLYSKSAIRTFGGAIVGGALMGGAGAMVGGLSGNTKKNMEIRTMNIKILMRNTHRATYILKFNDSKRVLKTKNNADNDLYERFKKNADKAKDLLSVIIDKVKQETKESGYQDNFHSVQQLSVADELAKLVKLKSEGIITKEEFNVQKSKLLNS